MTAKTTSKADLGDAVAALASIAGLAQNALDAGVKALANRDPQAGEAVACRWRWTAEAYGVDGATPGPWYYAAEPVTFPKAEEWRREVQPLYASPQDDRMGERRVHD